MKIVTIVTSAREFVAEAFNPAFAFAKCWECAALVQKVFKTVLGFIKAIQSNRESAAALDFACKEVAVPVIRG